MKNKSVLKNVYQKNFSSKTKTYSFRIPEVLYSRLMHIKNLTRNRKDININRGLEKQLYDIVVALEEVLEITKDDWKESMLCPSCGHKLMEKEGKRGAFIGCTNYPKCSYSREK